MNLSHRNLTIFLMVFLIALGFFIPAQSYGESCVAETALYPVCIENKWGYIDRLGNIIIPCQFAYAGEFRGNGYAMVCDIEENYGIISTSGSYMIYPVSLIDEGAELGYYGGKDTGVYWLFDGNAYAFFDVIDGYVSDFCFDQTQDPWFDGECSDFLRVTYDGQRYGYVNRRTGEQVVPFIYSQMNTVGFHHGFAIEELPESTELLILQENGLYMALPNGLAPVRGALFENERILVQDTTSKLYGYCDTQGNCVIPPQYEDAESFSNGYASVCVRSRWFHIDKYGMPMCSALFELPYFFYNNRAITQQNGLQVIIDPHGSIIKTFDGSVTVFNYLPQGIALFTDGVYTGIIDDSGIELIPLSSKFSIDCYQSYPALFCEDKQAFMDANGDWGFVDTSGQICQACQWDMASNYINGLATVIHDGIMYKIDHDGNVVWVGIP